jgi:hypothetical protein
MNLPFLFSDAAKETFDMTFNGNKNIMTPDIIGYYVIGNHYVEVSTGRGITTDVVYGITVLNLDGSKCEELNKCVFSKEEIIEHCSKIREID